MGEETSCNTIGLSWFDAQGHSTSYALFMLGLDVYSLVVMLGLVTTRLQLFSDQILWRTDVLLCIVFLFDFLLNLKRAPSKVEYFFRQGGWLDLIGSMPSVPGFIGTSFLRLARLHQIWRISRHVSGKDRGEVFGDTRKTPAKTALFTMIIAAYVLTTVASLLILWVEKDATGAKILTGADAYWWSVVTMTTVGYGDTVPVTYLGRLIALVVMIFGIGIFAVMTSVVASHILRLQDNQVDIADIVLADNAATRDENERLRAEIAEIKELLIRRENSD